MRATCPPVYHPWFGHLYNILRRKGIYYEVPQKIKGFIFKFVVHVSVSISVPTEWFSKEKILAYEINIIIIIIINVIIATIIIDIWAAR
jgi:hypothetical protein